MQDNAKICASRGGKCLIPKYQVGFLDQADPRFDLHDTNKFNCINQMRLGPTWAQKMSLKESL